MSEILDLTIDLVSRASVTPNDAGCQQVIATRLARAGFAIEHLRYGEVDNLWATHGSGMPVVVLLGHTDVVPTGPVVKWTNPPFEPTVRDGRLYGRGSADMKSGVAAMTIALEAFVAAHPHHIGTIALLLTSDEEGPSKDGVKRVVETFRERGQGVDFCIVGEPTSRECLGDLIRVGRRGSLSGLLTVHGVQGHIAYPQLARNPIHAFAPALAELVAEIWDHGNDAFPPTSLQFSNLNAGTGAGNIIPGALQARFNFRYCTASTAASLQGRVEAILRKHKLDWTVEWDLSGEPFVTREGKLRAATHAAIAEVCGVAPDADTGGGTSDSRFIAPLGAEVVEVGPVNATIHKIDENIALDELEKLPRLFLRIVEKLLVA